MDKFASLAAAFGFLEGRHGQVGSTDESGMVVESGVVGGGRDIYCSEVDLEELFGVWLRSVISGQCFYLMSSLGVFLGFLLIFIGELKRIFHNNYLKVFVSSLLVN